jgi:predicted dehydrogenase
LIRIGVVGTGFIARPHLQALRALPEIWGADVPRIDLSVACDERRAVAEEAARRHGIARVVDDWRRVTGDPEVDAVLVLTPNDLHAPVAIDALRHGKHILCEKPLADTVESAAALCAAARAAGTAAQVAFVYREWPAVRLARALVAAGEIGSPLAFHARFYHDYALDRAHPRSWRFERARAGAGSIGDLGSHLIDLARTFMGEVGAVQARTRTVIPARPGGGVDVDDAADVWLEFAGGATGSLATSWVAAGHKTDIAFEILGEHGSIRFAWQRANELDVVSGDLDAVRSIAIGPAHPGALWPIAGVGLGWADAFVPAARAFVDAAAGRPVSAPTFEDGLAVAEVVAAAIGSSRPLAAEASAASHAATQR